MRGNAFIGDGQTGENVAAGGQGVSNIPTSSCEVLELAQAVRNDPV